MAKHEIPTNDAHECERWMLRDYVNGVMGLKHCGACGAVRPMVRLRRSDDRRRHAACDCESYAQHRDLALINECGGPLATLLVERQRAEEITTRALMERCPWLHYHDAKTLAHWKPGDPFIIATEYRPFYAEQRCVCGRRRSEHLFAGDLYGDDLSELTRDHNMMCPDRVGLWFTPEDTAAR